MRRPTNTWYEAIRAQLRSAGGPLTVDQIWHGMEATGFQHTSAIPRRTLGARIAELAQREKIERVGRGSYQLAEEPYVWSTPSESQQEARVHAAVTGKLVSEGAS